MKKIILVSILLAAVPASASLNEIPLIGLDKNDMPIEIFVKKADFQSKMAQALSSVQDSTIPVLAKHETNKGWLLRTLVVGIGVSIEGGLGPLIELGVIPRFKVAFSNSTDPGLP